MAPIQKRLFQVSGLVLFQAVLLFAGAGRWDWLEGWLYLWLYLVFILANALILVPRNPELVAERTRVGPNTKRWDLYVSAGITLLGPAMLLVAGLDERWGWTNAYTLPTQAAGGLVIAIGYGFWAWAMASNRFFATTVRIQTERNHTLQTGGPYKMVRHPAYLGLILSTLGSPALLNAVTAFIPALLLVVVVVIRTGLEDATLQKELPGYAEFAQSTTCYRLIPGIW